MSRILPILTLVMLGFAEEAISAYSPTDVVTFESERGSVSVSAERDSLKMLGADKRLMAETAVRQWDSGRIDGLLKLGSDQVFVSGAEIDYIVPIIRLGSSLTFGIPAELPELYRTPCSHFQKFMGDCERSKGEVNEAYGDREKGDVYIEGYEPSLFGGERMKAYLVHEGKSAPAPLR